MSRFIGSTPSPGQDVPLWAVAPFALLLFSIAIVPPIVPHGRHKNRNTAIAEHADDRMPSFFVQMAWSLAILDPLLGAVTPPFSLKE